MQRSHFRLAGRAAIGFVIGFAAWHWLAIPYARVLGGVSELAIRLAEAPAVTTVTTVGTLMVVDRTDFPAAPGSQQLAVESTDLTFNIILLTTLFGASGRLRPLRNRRRAGFALIALFFVHVAAVISFIKADYATSFGSWSAEHYGSVSRSFWTAAPYFYAVVGVYGSAFALWWLWRPVVELPKAVTVRRGMAELGRSHASR